LPLGNNFLSNCLVAFSLTSAGYTLRTEKYIAGAKITNNATGKKLISKCTFSLVLNGYVNRSEKFPVLDKLPYFLIESSFLMMNIRFALTNYGGNSVGLLKPFGKLVLKGYWFEIQVFLFWF